MGYRKRVRAPAKLNLRLKVTGLRPDGYHELVSVMVPVRLFDVVELEKRDGAGVSLWVQGRSVPSDDENLVCRAARAFFSRAGFESGVAIRLTKNIPVAAGLGGGSSDAALTLMALNDMHACPLDEAALEGLARQLGADVAFFLKCCPCIASGIGDILEPIACWPKLWYVIVTPPFHVSTAWVYGNLKMELTTGEHDFIVSLLGQVPPRVVDILENDLEIVTASYFPVIHDIKKDLLNAGAEGVLMSGSGPSVFGVFHSKEKALAAETILRPRIPGDLFVVSGISQSEWGVVKR